MLDEYASQAYVKNNLDEDGVQLAAAKLGLDANRI